MPRRAWTNQSPNRRQPKSPSFQSNLSADAPAGILALYAPVPVALPELLGRRLLREFPGRGSDPDSARARRRRRALPWPTPLVPAIPTCAPRKYREARSALSQPQTRRVHHPLAKQQPPYPCGQHIHATSRLASDPLPFDLEHGPWHRSRIHSRPALSEDASPAVASDRFACTFHSTKSNPLSLSAASVQS